MKRGEALSDTTSTKRTARHHCKRHRVVTRTWPCLAPLTLACQLVMAEESAEPRELARLTEAAAKERDASLDGFDAGVLARRGIDPAVANSLLRTPRLEPGLHRLSLSVNGHPRGRVSVRMNAEGKPCFSKPFMVVAGIQFLEADTVPIREAQCLPFLETYPAAQAITDVATLSLSLLVPTDTVRPEARDHRSYASGGTAGLVNYELSTLRSRLGSSGTSQTSLNSEIGFNAGNWILRNRRIDTHGGGARRHASLETYVQRSFAGERVTLQAGDLNPANPVVPVSRIRGFQLSTENAIAADDVSTPIEGIAQSPATVVVRQNGRTIYTTVVPAGPFSLRDVHPPDRQADLELLVIETDGRERSMVIPGIALSTSAPNPGFSAGVGQTRDFDVAGTRNSWVASLGWSGRMGRLLNGSVGAVASPDFRATGGALDLSLPRRGLTLRGQATVSQDTFRDVTGSQVQLAASHRISEQWAIRAAVSRQTTGYRSLHDAMVGREVEARPARYRDQRSLSLSWSHSLLGSINTGVSDSILVDGRRSRRWTASWGRGWPLFSVNANINWGRGQNGDQDNAAFLNINVPLGARRSARLYVSDRGGDARYGVNYNERVNDTIAYRASSERRSRGQGRNESLGATVFPRYAQVDLNYSRTSDDHRSFSGFMRGGVVIHGEGVTFSPHRIADTFAVVRVGERAGVRLDTPGGPVWTDYRGRAVAALLHPYSPSKIEVATASLPRNVDLSNGTATLNAQRGTVERLNFETQFARRILFTVRMPDGGFVPFGTAIADDNGDLVGLAMAEGRVFVGRYEPGMKLWASPSGGPRCALHFAVPHMQEAAQLYEVATAECRPTDE